MFACFVDKHKGENWKSTMGGIEYTYTNYSYIFYPGIILCLILCVFSFPFFLSPVPFLGNCHRPQGAFEGLLSLEWLKLNGNRLKRISGLASLPVALKGVYLEENPWECDCRLLELRLWLTERNVANSMEPRCSGPDRLTNSTLKEVSEENFACIPELSPTTMYQKIGKDTHSFESLDNAFFPVRCMQHIIVFMCPPHPHCFYPILCWESWHEHEISLPVYFFCQGLHIVYPKRLSQDVNVESSANYKELITEQERISLQIDMENVTRCSAIMYILLTLGSVGWRKGNIDSTHACQLHRKEKAHCVA